MQPDIQTEEIQSAVGNLRDVLRSNWATLQSNYKQNSGGRDLSELQHTLGKDADSKEAAPTLDEHLDKSRQSKKSSDVDKTVFQEAEQLSFRDLVDKGPRNAVEFSILNAARAILTPEQFREDYNNSSVTLGQVREQIDNDIQEMQKKAAQENLEKQKEAPEQKETPKESVSLGDVFSKGYGVLNEIIESIRKEGVSKAEEASPAEKPNSNIARSTTKQQQQGTTVSR